MELRATECILCGQCEQERENGVQESGGEVGTQLVHR